jgi:hypothetical protein
MDDFPRLLLTVKETAAALRVSLQTLYTNQMLNDLEPLTIGNRRFVTVASVQSYIARRVTAGRDANGKVILDTRLDGLRTGPAGRKASPLPEAVPTAAAPVAPVVRHQTAARKPPAPSAAARGARKASGR